MRDLFYIQSGYKGKEVGSLMVSLPKGLLIFSATQEWRGEIPVGSVEFVESLLGQKAPNYYPAFLEKFFHREIYKSESLPEKVSFVKPADKHKRFTGKILHKGDLSEYVEEGWKDGPYWISEIVYFKEEWRYYVANGKVLDAYWYLGEENELTPPKIDVSWPSDFCGAVDFGRLRNGKIALVENNLPYACGWYGPYEKGKIYAEWLKKGWEYINENYRN